MSVAGLLNTKCTGRRWRWKGVLVRAAIIKDELFGPFRVEGGVKIPKLQGSFWKILSSHCDTGRSWQYLRRKIRKILYHMHTNPSTASQGGLKKDLALFFTCPKCC